MWDIFWLGFEEEVTDCITRGVMAFLYICSLPATAIYSYDKSGGELMAGASIFILCLLLMSLVSTLYHCMPFGTIRKYAFHKLGHIYIYFVMVGSYTPITLVLIDGWQGHLILVIERNTVLGGVLLRAISSENYPKLSITAYMIMGQMVIFLPLTLLSKASPPFLTLIVSGGVVYTTGTFFYGKPQKKHSHSIWHVRVDLVGVLYSIAIVSVI